MIRPLWVQMGVTGVFLLLAASSPNPALALGGFLVGIVVALWK